MEVQPPSSPLPIYIQDMNIEEERDDLEFDPFEDARKLKAYLEGMETFKERLSKLSGAKVTVVNDVDMCPPPLDFGFIEIYSGIHFDVLTSSSEGCGCPNGVCISSICKCNLKLSRKKKHREEDSKPLYECNANCPCGPFCPNRRIQREGRTVPLEIFRTDRKGWGLKARRPVQRGEFIDRYVGEVLTPAQADERADIIYQFDLDYCFNPDEQGEYVVDAKSKGGVGRFMNHSCEPNCHVRPMFIWGRDETLPEIGFFASRDIKDGEELTFDYFGDQKTNGTHPCECNAPNCKGYLFP
jgi:histone-lysine N-methyltransferase SUV39H